MRKLITPKKFPEDHEDQEKCCCRATTRLNPTPVRQRICPNNWAARNDSSHIDAILHPENYLDSPCKWNAKNRGETAKVVKKKCCVTENNCYCREISSKIPRPKILTRPKSCITIQDREKNILENRDTLKRRSLECVCKDDAKTERHRRKSLKTRTIIHKESDQELRTDDELLSKNNIGLEFTEQRKASELFSKDEYEAYLQKICDYEHGNQVDDTSEKNHDQQVCYLFDSDYDNEEIATLMGTKRTYPETYSTNYVTESRFQSVNDLADFRQKHYFETHALTDDTATGNHHTCVHQFRLDDRLLPEALNQDSFGRSRCVSCSRTMEGSSIYNLSRSYFGSSGPTKASIRNFAKCYEYGFVPKTVYMGDDNTAKNVIKLSKDEVPKMDGILKKMKKMRFCNTLALRQQKMSL